MEEYIDLLKNILDKSSLHADYVDIRCGKGYNTSLLMKDGKIQETKTGNNLGASIRVLQNGVWGFAYTNDLTKLEQISENSIKLTNKMKSNIELKETEIIKDTVETKVKIPFKDVSIEEKKSLMDEINNAANLDKIKSITINYSDSVSNSIFLNSEGSEIQNKTSQGSIITNTTANDGDINQFSMKTIRGNKGFEVFDKDLEKFGREVATKTLELLKAKPAPSGQFKIITDPALTGVLMHEAIGHAVESDLVLQDCSILKNKINEQIGSELVNIYDDPTCKDAFGSYKYDSEGVKAKKTHILKDGKLNNYLTSRETAAKLNTESTGNARSSISEKPIVRMSNTYLEPKDLSFEELIEDISDGIYLKGSKGGQVDTNKGIFQFNAKEGYLIKKGEISTQIRDVSLSGEILNTLKNIDGVGSDFKLTKGYCGKGGQIIPVGDGGPHTRFVNATVGGSG